MLFLKPTSAICGPEDEIVIPRSARGENNDYEVEVCVVMGKKAKDVSVEKALDYVLGYCTSNDVSFVGGFLVVYHSRCRSTDWFAL